MKDIRWQAQIPGAMRALADGYYALLSANEGLDRSGYASPLYGQRIAAVDSALLILLRARWKYNRATGENAERSARSDSPEEDILGAIADGREAAEFGRAIADTTGPLPDELVDRGRSIRSGAGTRGTEISFFDGIPIVPAIAPIVIVQGSSREMGHQYAVQVLEIFGRFVFEQISARRITKQRADVLAGWTEQLQRHTPEIVDFAEGIADGAAASGVPMTGAQAMSLITDICPPATEPLPIGVLDAEGGGAMGAYFGVLMEQDLTSAGPDGPCSGAAAWGSATADSRAHFAASTDHDCDFQVTIVAFPDDGNAFIHTPFSVTGSIAGVGRFGLAGHPSINSAGVGYVHHGGGNSCAEPRASWGYGVSRGASVMHAMRYANSARDALDMELALPVGDAGRLLGSAGGFYVDSQFGYVLEDRTPGRPVVRDRTFTNGGADFEFLYATNNIQSPELKGAFCPPAGGYDFSVEAGWYTDRPESPTDVGAGISTRQLWANSSGPRNRFLHHRLVSSSGSVTAEMLRDLFREGPDLGAGAPAEAPVGHRGNAFVAFGTPSLGRYSAAVGMIAPRWTGPNHGHGFFYYGETGTYWDVVLDQSPAALVDGARASAMRDIDRAGRLLAESRHTLADAASLDALLAEARAEYSAGTAPAKAAPTRIANLARSCRAFTRAQVRARQVIIGTGTSV